MKKILFSIGTNMGNRKKNLNDSIHHISNEIGHIVSISSVYETEPWGFSSQNKFLNIAIEVSTDLLPLLVLEKLLYIEKLMGRVRTSAPGYSSRIIDIDILLYSNEIISEPDLIIPHPFISDRMFVLAPLSEIAGNFIHPTLKKTIQQLSDECTNKTGITNIGSL